MLIGDKGNKSRAPFFLSRGFRSASVYLRVWLLSDVSYSDECRSKKYFQYAENMFPLFFAILKFPIYQNFTLLT